MLNINPTLAANEVVESAGPDLAALCLMEPTTNDINRDPASGTYVGATEMRKDGQAAGY